MRLLLIAALLVLSGCEVRPAPEPFDYIGYADRAWKAGHIRGLSQARNETRFSVECPESLNVGVEIRPYELESGERYYVVRVYQREDWMGQWLPPDDHLRVDE